MKDVMQTIAEKISTRFGDDGQRWKDADGASLGAVMEAEGARRDVDMDGDTVRWIFADGSVITTCDGGWDLGCLGCYGWPSEGHEADCMEALEVEEHEASKYDEEESE